MRNIRADIIAVALIFLMIGIVVDNSIIHILCNNEKFFEVRLYEVIQTVTTVIIAAFISYIVSRRINIDVKRREVILKVIDLFQDRIADVYKNGTTYLNIPTKELEKSILSDIKLADGTLSIIKSIKEIDADMYTSVFKSFVSFKSALTGHPFGAAQPIFDQNNEEKVSNRYAQHLNSLQRMKISIFSSK